MDSFQLLNDLIIRKTFKSIKLLNKQLNDNIHICSQEILDFVIHKSQYIETTLIFHKVKNLHNSNFRQLDVF